MVIYFRNAVSDKTREGIQVIHSVLAKKNMTKDGKEWKERINDRLFRDRKTTTTRFDVYETLCPQQMLVHKGGQIKNWSGECRDIIPTKLQCQTIQRAL